MAQMYPSAGCMQVTKNWRLVKAYFDKWLSMSDLLGKQVHQTGITQIRFTMCGFLAESQSEAVTEHKITYLSIRDVEVKERHERLP